MKDDPYWTSRKNSLVKTDKVILYVVVYLLLYKSDRNLAFIPVLMMIVCLLHQYCWQGITCVLVCGWKNCTSPVADWDNTCTAIISACIVDNAAWSTTWVNKDAGIVVPSLDVPSKKLSF